MKKKHETLSFKADTSLLDAMKGVPNRSEFIRSAILAALDSACPLCRGTGILTPNQRKHWRDFSVDHSLKKCADCNEIYVVCANKPKRKPRQKRR